jgi:LuxR family maltose regulon positive regulatory protein
MVGSPIVSKITVPTRSADILYRARLVDFLHENIDRRLVLISAPAGYGKTTLLMDFAHETDLAVCWYTLDPTDRDPRVFIEHFLASLERRFPGFGSSTRSVLGGRSVSRGDMTRVVATLVNEMAAKIREWFVVVLDDFHCVAAAPDLNAFLTALLTYQPEHCHLVIASRTVPTELPLVSLAAREVLAELGQESLRFTPAEIQALFHQRYQVELSPEAAESLAAESEGWITGILLTSDSPWHTALEVWARARASGRPLYEYLAGEVLNRQRLGLRGFLLASSTLEVMTPALCAGVLELRRGEKWLNKLEQQNLFIARLDGEENLFRYHTLFREFLQAQLERQSPDKFRRLHRRAAAWLEADGDVERAARHWLTAGEPEQAARVMEHAAQTMVRSGHLKTLFDWAAQLPAGILRSRPRLAFYAADAACGVGRLTQALSWLKGAKDVCRELGEKNRLALALATEARIRYNQGRYAEGARLAEKALHLTTPDQDDFDKARAEASRIQGLSLVRLGQCEKAEQLLRATLEEEHKAVRYVHCQILVRQGLAFCLERLGRLEEAMRVSRTVVETCRRLESPTYLAEALNDLACQQYMLGEYGQALTTLEEALTTAREIGHKHSEGFALVSLGEMLRGLGDLDGAAEALAEGMEIARDLDNGALLAHGREALALLALVAGDVSKALEMAQQAVDLAEEQQARTQAGRYQATLGLAQAKAGETAESVGSLERACVALEEVGAMHELARARLLLAYALGQGGRDEQVVRQALDDAVALYLGNGRAHRLPIEGQPILPFLEKAAADRVEGTRLTSALEEADRFRAAAGSVLRTRAAEGAPAPGALRVYGFGISRVKRDGVLVPHDEWPTATARHLLVYVALHPPRTREQIGADLWPNLRAARLPGTFHTTKYRLQKVLGLSPISFNGGLYSLCEDLDFWCDVSEFEALLERASRSPPALAARHIRRAMTLYTGDFLEECYADWCVTRRERMRELYLEAVTNLTTWLLRQRRLDEAISVLRRGLEVDDLREDLHRRLMQAFALDGRPSEALVQYRRCMRALRRELRIEPAPETQNLLDAIQRDLFPP